MVLDTRERVESSPPPANLMHDILIFLEGNPTPQPLLGDMFSNIARLPQLENIDSTMPPPTVTCLYLIVPVAPRVPTLTTPPEALLCLDSEYQLDFLEQYMTRR